MNNSWILNLVLVRGDSQENRTLFVGFVIMVREFIFMSNFPGLMRLGCCIMFFNITGLLYMERNEILSNESKLFSSFFGKSTFFSSKTADFWIFLIKS